MIKVTTIMTVVKGRGGIYYAAVQMEEIGIIAKETVKRTDLRYVTTSCQHLLFVGVIKFSPKTRAIISKKLAVSL